MGAYYDYISYYKKNPHLSSTTKEKLNDFIRKTKSDKDRFAQDYLTWVLFEYEGKIRMNTVVREIFYRYCPFKAEVRSEMAKKPLYSDMEVKFQNRRLKELLKVESRILKFEKQQKKVPEELSNYLAFLKS